MMASRAGRLPRPGATAVAVGRFADGVSDVEDIMGPVKIRRPFRNLHERASATVAAARASAAVAGAITLLVALSLTLSLALAACGGGDETTTTTTGLPEETTTTTLPGGLTTIPEPSGGETTTTTSSEETTTTTGAPVETTAPTGGQEPAPGEEVLPNGHIKVMGFIKSLRESDGKRYLTIDYAEMLTGEAAVRAAREAGDIGPDEDLPNDYYISNPTSDKQEFEVSADAALTTSSWHGEMEKTITWDVFKSFWSVSPPDQEAFFLRDSPWWIERDGSTVVRIDEQYLP